MCLSFWTVECSTLCFATYLSTIMSNTKFYVCSFFFFICHYSNKIFEHYLFLVCDYIYARLILHIIFNTKSHIKNDVWCFFCVCFVLKFVPVCSVIAIINEAFLCDMSIVLRAVFMYDDKYRVLKSSSCKIWNVLYISMWHTYPKHTYIHTLNTQSDKKWIIVGCPYFSLSSNN